MIVSQSQFLRGSKPTLVLPASANFDTSAQDTEEKKPGFISNLKNDLTKRVDNVKNFSSTNDATSPGAFEKFGVGVGQAVGAVGDVIGEGAKSIYGALPQGVQNVVGPAAKKSFASALVDTVIPGAKSIPEPLKDLIGGKLKPHALQALQGGVEKYQAFKKKNPVAATEFEASLNILSAIPIGKGASVAGEEATALAKATGKTVSEVGTSALDKTGKGLMNVGERIQNVVIKPTQTDIKNGFKIENLAKYDLNGPLDEVLPKTTSQLKNSVQELNKVVAQVKDKPTINLNNALTEIQSEFKSKGLKELGSRGSIDKTVETIKSELDTILPGWEKKTINFGDAIEAKRAAGLNSAFLHGQMRQGLTAEERVWNNFYKILQRETEKVAKGTQFESLNKKISELIPIEQAAIRRIPVAERNNVISLTDLLSGLATVSDPRALTVGIANRLLKSGTVAKHLIKAGKKLKR